MGNFETIINTVALKAAKVPKLNFKQIWPYVFPMLQAILIFVIGHFVIKICLRFIDKALAKTKIDSLVLNLLNKATDIVLHIIVVLSALTSIGVSTTGLLAALSAVAAGIALALKDSFGNIAGGIMLICSPRFSAGDCVRIDGEEGMVVKIDLTHTKILNYNNNEISLPNGVLVNSKIINLTREGIRRIDITVPLPYECDIEKAQKIICGVMDNTEKVFCDDNHKQFAKIMSYGESSINMLCCTWCVPSDYWTAYFALMEGYIKALGKEGIYVPYNKLDVNLNTKED